MSIKTFTLALTALSLATLAGCAPRFDHLDFVESTSPPLPVTLLQDGVTLTEGVAVAFTPLPMTDSGRMDEDTVVSLISSDPRVLGVSRTGETSEFVMFGAGVGRASISIFIDGDAVGTLPATVVAQ